MNKSVKLVLIIVVILLIVFALFAYRRSKRQAAELNQPAPTSQTTSGTTTEVSPSTTAGSIDQELQDIEKALDQANPDDSNLQGLGGSQ